jgi:hypothetical protein
LAWRSTCHSPRARKRRTTPFAPVSQHRLLLSHYSMREIEWKVDIFSPSAKRRRWSRCCGKRDIMPSLALITETSTPVERGTELAHQTNLGLIRSLWQARQLSLVWCAYVGMQLGTTHNGGVPCLPDSCCPIRSGGGEGVRNERALSRVSGGRATLDILAKVQIPVQAADRQEHAPGCVTDSG